MTNSSEKMEPRRLFAGTPATSLGIGFLGDSYTDEYQFYPIRDTAKNYVELLAQQRDLNFGPFSASDDNAVGHHGYAYNWAISGATSSDMITEELPGLVKQVHSHKVRIVFMFIGGNDFNALLTSADPLATLGSLQSTVTSNIEKAANEILAASGGAHVVIGNLPDISLLPQGQEAEADGVPAFAMNYLDSAEHSINSAIASYAAAHSRVMVANMQGLFSNLLSNGSFTIDGHAISSTQDGDVPTDAFLADDTHPGTILQAEIANLYVRTVDSGMGLTIQPFSNKQILDAAGI
jgi:phospholipase/lecithinase/hemolysin